MCATSNTMPPFCSAGARTITIIASSTNTSAASRYWRNGGLSFDDCATFADATLIIQAFAYRAWFCPGGGKSTFFVST